MAKSRGLGRGLDALFLDNQDGAGTETPQMIKISEISPNRDQPRKNFEPEALEELKQSILQHGVITPILLANIPGGGYKIVAGERRFRAAIMAGLTQIPAVVKDLDELQTAQLALVENLQREDLNPVEEAQGYKILMEQFSLTQDDIAKRVNKSRSTVANLLRIFSLPADVVELIRNQKISLGHAKVLMGVLERSSELAKQVVEEDLSVRMLEERIKEQSKKPKPHVKISNEVVETQLSLTRLLGREVKVKSKGKGGTISLEYFDLEDLEKITKKLL